MEHSWQDRLSEYVDGTLGPLELAECEAHLARCSECTALMLELRAVARRAARLPVSAPHADLWPDIAARIGRPDVVDIRRARRPRLHSWMAAAAVAVFLAGGALVVGIRQLKAPETTQPPVAVTQPAPAGELTVLPAMARAEETYSRAESDLRAILDEGRDRLDPKTVMVLERNLALIDSAIADTETALRNDPASAYLNSYLARTMQRKLALLRQAATLVQARS